MLDAELDARLTALIRRLAEREPVDKISDAVINAEVRAVRQSWTKLAKPDRVWQRPRLRKHISSQDAQDLLEQMRLRSILVNVTTIPPHCRDPKDQPVLATAIDGHADAIVTGDADLRADDTLRDEMAVYGVQLGGVETLLEQIA